MRRNPFTRTQVELNRRVQVAVAPAISFTRPGTGQTAGGNDGSGVWKPWSMLDVDVLDSDGGFVVSDEGDNNVGA